MDKMLEYLNKVANFCRVLTSCLVAVISALIFVDILFNIKSINVLGQIIRALSQVGIKGGVLTAFACIVAGAIIAKKI